MHLADHRYEVRDVQTVIGFLVDEGIADAARIGVTGESYGGGTTLQLATLGDRIMLADGSLEAWQSLAGVPLKAAAAASVAMWTDLAYSLLPNGRMLDTEITPPTAALEPAGVVKMSYLSGLYALGNANGYVSPAFIDPEADLTTWYTQIMAGGPYEANPNIRQILKLIAKYHSAYYLLDGSYGVPRQAPPPLFLSSGWADDLFPVNESLRYYNLHRVLYPTDPISLWFADLGHARSQNKPADMAQLVAAIEAFFDYHLKGEGEEPQTGVTAMTVVCEEASEGPLFANSWEALHPNQMIYASEGTMQSEQTVLSLVGDPLLGAIIDPVAGSGVCATGSTVDQGEGVATYRLPASIGDGFTLIGAPQVTAELTANGDDVTLLARLWDIDTLNNTQTLVARGVYRPDPEKSGELQTFQLHPTAWRFRDGHIPKLELLGQDAPYLRPSNIPFTVSVSNLTLSLPVR